MGGTRALVKIAGPTHWATREFPAMKTLSATLCVVPSPHKKGTRDSVFSDTSSESLEEASFEVGEEGFLLFFGQAMRLVGSQFPHQRLNPGPRQ